VGDAEGLSGGTEGLSGGTRGLSGGRVKDAKPQEQSFRGDEDGLILQASLPNQQNASLAQSRKRLLVFSQQAFWWDSLKSSKGETAGLESRG